MDRAEQDAVDHQHTSHHHDHEDGPHGPEHDPSQVLSDIGNAGMGRVLAEGGGVHRSATGPQQLDETVARTIEERRGRGSPLDTSVRADMEATLGHDLSDVNVHTDREAHELNQAVSARAFTTGNDVFFTQGTYDPASSAGRHLLAHELTHVAQQRQGTSGLGAGEVSDPADAAEVEADAVGAQVASGQAPSADAVGTTAGVQREEEEEELQLSAEPEVQREEEEEFEEELPGG